MTFMSRKRSDRCRLSPVAFTLIELLVVISIIALLIGLLLPSLSKARAAARTGVCLAQQRQAGVGMQSYATDNNDWLAGPNTSGRYLTSRSPILGGASTSPTQNLDWVSPTLGDALNLPSTGSTDPSKREEVRQERMRAIFEQKFACPANKEFYDGNYGGDNTLGGRPVTELRVSSYAAAIGFHASSRNWEADNLTDTTPGSRFPVDLKGYLPKIDQIRRPEVKAYAMDGTRYLTPGTWEMTFNAFIFQDEGGNFMAQGPAIIGMGGDPHTAGGGGPNFDSEQREAMERFAYRHDSKLVVSFFDGHAEAMVDEDTRKMSLWFPSGSVVKAQNFEGLRPGSVIE